MMQVGQFIESVKQEPEDDLGAVLYGGSVVKAPKVLADIVEAIAAAVYVDCKFDLEKLWKVIFPYTLSSYTSTLLYSCSL
jgi:dsRNA-specific ribonuclease